MKLSNADAKFIGWQETPKGEAFTLFTVIAAYHPLFGSTVTEKTLRKHNLQIPPTPLPQEQFKNN